MAHIIGVHKKMNIYVYTVYNILSYPQTITIAKNDKPLHFRCLLQVTKTYINRKPTQTNARKQNQDLLIAVLKDGLYCCWQTPRNFMDLEPL